MVMANGEELSLRAHRKQKALRLGLSMDEISSTFCYWHSFAHNSFASPERRKKKGGLCWWLFRSRQKFSVLLLSRLASLNRFLCFLARLSHSSTSKEKSFAGKATLETEWDAFVGESLYVQVWMWQNYHMNSPSLHPSIKIRPKERMSRINDNYVTHASRHYSCYCSYYSWFEPEL